MKNLTLILVAVVMMMMASCKKEDAIIVRQIETIRDTIIKKDSVIVNGADVVYSDWLSPKAETPGGGIGGGGTTGGSGGGSSTPTGIRTFTVSAPKISQEILDKGVVLAYCRLYNDNNLTRKLATTTIEDGYLCVWDYALSKGSVQFIQTSGNPKGIPAISSNHKFRYVIIPSVRHVRLSKPITQMSYDEVCTLFNIPK
ncbi:MAG TPA: hypothetical protein PLJ42_03230 [Chitinophagales bacterium]|jgi:hypothetical protein|nr:hypothetical protein [Chitinophagales bacterium]MBP6154736.1 hypothetical protein [Chitinophagales bacterium]HQV77359.1 hypothetical protein [Chitinophagales bacterium]HQW78421.1 hypothetical protein [Chitinophagales bacterium]